MIDYIEDTYAKVSLDTGGYLWVTPDIGSVMINGGTELSDEDMKDAIFSIRKTYYTGLQVLQQVTSDWDAALAEQSQAEADEAAHIERYSSVEGSGRI